jgi:hypothetical protein
MSSVIHPLEYMKPDLRENGWENISSINILQDNDNGELLWKR